MTVCQIPWLRIFFQKVILCISNCIYNLSIYMLLLLLLLLSLLLLLLFTIGLNRKKIHIKFGGDKSLSRSYSYGDKFGLRYFCLEETTGIFCMSEKIWCASSGPGIFRN